MTPTAIADTVDSAAADTAATATAVANNATAAVAATASTATTTTAAVIATDTTTSANTAFSSTNWWRLLTRLPQILLILLRLSIQQLQRSPLQLRH